MGKRKRRGSRWSYQLYLILIVLLFVAILVGFFVNLSKIVANQKLDAEIIVGDKYGFDINASALKFGEIAPSGSSARRVVMENKYSSPLAVEIYVHGDIARFLTSSEDNFILKVGETKNVTFSVYAPMGTDYGKYVGEVVFVEKLV